MSTNKRYEILDSLPVYGPMYIPVTKSDVPFYSEGFAVRFFPTDGTAWVANFQPGWTDLKLVIELNDSSILLVIAYGTCYMMNPDQTNPIAAFGVTYLQVFITEAGRIILQDQTDLTIVEPNGTYWDTERISWDGLEEVELQGSTVTGLAYNPTYDSDDWVTFSYNIDTKELGGGSFPLPDKTYDSE